MNTKSILSGKAMSCVLAGLLMFSAGSAMATLSAGKINGAAAGTGTACTIGTPPVLSVVNDSGHSAVWVKFMYNGSTWRLQMVNGGSAYSVTMPVIPAGTVSYRFEAGPAFASVGDITVEAALPTVSTWYTYVNSETLPELRKPVLSAWVSTVGEGPTLFTGSINAFWRGVKLTMNGVDDTVNLVGYSTLMTHNNDPHVRTLATANVGSIWFKARFTGDTGTGTLYVEKSTSSTFTVAHTLIEEVSVPYTSDWVQYRIDVNSDSVAYYRIRRPSAVGNTDAKIRIKDIVISPATADVVISKDLVEHSPGYPSRFDPITFKIAVTNVYAGAPASNISPKLVWRLNKGLDVGVWTNTPMPSIGGNQYQVTLPPLDPGEFQYYYRADFTGYAYTGPLYVTSGNPVDNVADFSKWLGAGDIIAETRNPAYYPDFTDSQLYNLAVDPPVCINDASELEENFDYLSFTIRRFKSRHDEVNLNVMAMDGTDLSVEPEYKMEQVGDYIWQAVMHVTNAIDIGVNIIGTERYTDGAVAFESVPHTWSEDDQDDTAKNPPMAGTVVDNTGTERILIEIDYNGFLMFRFCTTNGNYEVRRAAWQDFNAWQAPNTEFTRSFGLYETTSFESDLTGVSPTFMESAGIMSFETGSTALDTMLSSYYLNGLLVDQAWLIEERLRAIPTNIVATTPKNRALKLSADTAVLGSVQTTSVTGSDGRDTLTMKVRASVDDNYRAYYRFGDTFADYIVTAKATTTSMSDDDASISVYGYYQDELNYIQGRLTQLTTLRSNYLDANSYFWFKLDLIQVKNGVETVLGTVNYNTTSTTTKLTSAPWYLKLKITSAGQAEFYISADGTAITSTTGSKAFTLDPSVPAGGTIGVNARDAATAFALSMQTSAGGTTPAFNAVAASVASDWYLGGKRTPSSLFRWTFASVSGAATLTRVIPDVKYRVYVYRDGVTTNNFVAPVPTATEDWDANWDDVGTEDAERTVNSLAWQTITVPMHLWDEVFIQVKPTGSDGALVVDDMSVNAWRGQTLYDPALAPGDSNEALVWKSTYAVASSFGSSMMYELARSRANPNDDQKIVSPLLVNGIGDILFNYRVTSGTVSFSVQSLTSLGTVHETLMTTNVTAAMTPSFERMYVAALTNMTGRLRIIINNAGSSIDGVLRIDNLKVTDYPAKGDTSWEAYNILISNFDFNPEIKFDGAANTDYRSAVVNNSYTDGTPLNVPYDDDEPYLQSPKIETGIGEVSFWYRSYPDAVNPGRIYLKAAKSISDPEWEWITLGVLDLNPDAPTYAEQVSDLNNITNVMTDTWTYFSVEFYKADYKILRLYGDTDNSSRVMLDNIIVTEPVRSSIDIQSVELTPAVPLYTDNVGVRVNLANPRMNPHNIEVSLLYTVGTNIWGRQNWMGSATVVPLVQDPLDKYLFTVTNGIPKLPIDTVVQYAVKVTYDGTFPADVYSGDDFVNPEWYEPIDLNEMYATNGIGRSAYYYVFSVGTNCVFINEFLPYAYSFGTYYGLSEQYVELLGPDNGNLANWRLEHVKVENSLYQDSVMWTNVMKPGAVFTSRFVGGSTEPTDKGWGFYTLACDGVSVTNSHFSAANPILVDQGLFPSSLYTPDYTGFAGSESVAMGVPGALCLKRSMGAYVQRVAWGQATTIAPLVQRGYTALDNRGTSTTNRRRVYMWADNGDQNNPALAWVIVSDLFYSPGYYNDGQAELIWATDPASEETPANPPAVTTAISSMSVGATKATVLFDVASTNGIALTAGDGFTWYIETSPDTTFASPTQHEITTPDITASDDGSPSSYSVDVDLDDPVEPTLFYRVKAVAPVTP